MKYLVTVFTAALMFALTTACASIPQKCMSEANDQDFKSEQAKMQYFQSCVDSRTKLYQSWYQAQAAAVQSSGSSNSSSSSAKNALSSQSLNCTSYQFGNSTSTHCF